MKIRILHKSIVSKTNVDKVYDLLCITSRVMTVKNENGEKFDIYIDRVIDARPVQ